MPINGIVDEETYDCAIHWLNTSGGIIYNVSSIMYLLLLFENISICLVYENSEDKSNLKVYSRHLAEYGKLYCDASEDDLKEFVRWRNCLIHESLNYVDLIHLTRRVYKNIVKFDKLFRKYGACLSLDGIRSALDGFLHYVLVQNEDAPEYSKIKYKDKYKIEVYDKCPKCGNTDIIKTSTNYWCIKCGWKHTI